MSNFAGLELAKKALFAQQNGLYTTGHNIANVNTPNYSRQRVNFETDSPFPAPGRNRPDIPGQLGTGVKISTVQRIRDKFLDFQYRNEASRVNYWQTKNVSLNRMEQLLNEPSDEGLSKMIDSFWSSIQEVANNPDNAGARAVVVQRGIALAETFNYTDKSLKSIQNDIGTQITASVDDVNSLVRQINAINEQIRRIEPHGMLPNDLYDERDQLLDELSEFVNIKVTYTKSANSSLSVADGLASIELVDSSGNSFGEGVYLIDIENADTLSEAINELKIEIDEENPSVTKISVDGSTNLGDMDLLQSIGKISSLIESYGYVNPATDEIVGDYPDMMAELDKLAKEFAKAFNEVHRAGKGINATNDQASNINFFINKEGSNLDEITAGNLFVNQELIDDPNLFAASLPEAGSNNADNALELANMFDKGVDELGGHSVRKYYTNLIGELGVKGQEARRMEKNSGVLADMVDHERMSVSAVSLDEEMSNLIKFQHAYNAAARNMTAIDEMLDRIINGLGLVGR